MNDSQIRTFLTVAKLSNFSKAAEQLFVTQPTISKSISLLEKELDTILFRRLPNRKIELTETGKIYYELFRDFSKKYDLAKSKVANMQTDVMIIRFAHASGWNLAEVLPSVMNTVQTHFPSTEFETQVLSFSEIETELRKKGVDMAISFNTHFQNIDGIHQAEIGKSRRVIIYSNLYIEKHGIVKSPNDFADATFFLVDSDRQRGRNSEIIQYSASYGFTPQFQYVRNLETMLAKVESGLGVAFFDSWGLKTVSQRNLLHIELNSSHAISMAWLGSIPEEFAHCFTENLRQHYVNFE